MYFVSKKIGLVFLLVLSIISHFDAFAGVTHTLEKAFLQEYFNYEVDRFETGDEVVIADQGVTLKTFKLGKFLGQGSGGRVFRLEGVQQPLIVKFRYGGSIDRDLMKAELDGFRILKNENIPHPSIIETDSTFYILKEFVSGRTLDQATHTWNDLDTDTQEAMIRSLKGLQSQLKTSRFIFHDLRGPNLIFDRISNVWKVIDVGPVSLPSIHRFMFSKPHFDDPLADFFGGAGQVDIQDFFAPAANERPDSFESIMTSLGSCPRMKAAFDNFSAAGRQ